MSHPRARWIQSTIDHPISCIFDSVIYSHRRMRLPNLGSPTKPPKRNFLPSVGHEITSLSSPLCYIFTCFLPFLLSLLQISSLAPLLQHPQPTLLPQCERSDFKSTHNKHASYVPRFVKIGQTDQTWKLADTQTLSWCPKLTLFPFRKNGRLKMDREITREMLNHEKEA